MRKRFVHNTVDSPPEQQYRIRNRFAYDNALSQEDTTAFSSIATSSRQNNTPLLEDDNTRTSSPSSEDDNTRTSTPSSEDDDGMDFRYDYEYDDMEFQYNFEYDNMDSHDEYNDMEVEEEEEEENVEEHRQVVVDEALSRDKMTFCNNDSELAPYFENSTAASLFCWLQKYNISTNAYEDLAKILHNSDFNPVHVMKNVRRFRKWRERLPLLPISARPISISSKKTPSTSKDSKTAYQLSISDIIYYVLNNPSTFKHMYFGPGINSETKSEYWHGTLWGESPLFGEDQITISGGNNIIYL